MRIIKVTNVEQFAAKILPKQPQNNKTIVESILKDVKKNGDVAIKKYEKKFSKANISSLRLTQNEIKNAYSKISKSELDALKKSKDRLGKTETIVKSLLKNITINQDGIKISKKFIAIQSVGCYIPGEIGRAHV